MSTTHEYWCSVCQEQIEGDDIEVRHSDPFTGDDVHDRCCVGCQWTGHSTKYFDEQNWMERYLKNPNFCPYCETKGVTTYNRLVAEIDFAWSVIECLSCLRRWKEIYSLTAIEELEDNDE